LKYRKKKFHKRKPKKRREGLVVEVYDNNIERALKEFKKIVKKSNLMMDLKEKQYYTKPSERKRQRRNLAKLRSKYNTLKENNK